MGSTVPKTLSLNFPGDHPHIHGEHSTRAKARKRSSGSPPYTWGALYDWNEQGKADGITPIYMGSTVKKVAPSARSEDHPHIHGEHFASDTVDLPSRGSPPYTWGAPSGDSVTYLGEGITPIYMGSTLKDPRNQAIFKSSKTLFQSVWSTELDRCLGVR